MNANSADEAFSLFIDGLPWEMNWSWLLQIFIGEGEVSDVYVSHKRRRFNNSKFGFVRFKKLEEATNAINKLNGLWIRGRRIMVAFAKYGRKRVFQNGSAIVETDKKEELIGDGMISTSGARMGGVSMRWWRAGFNTQSLMMGIRETQVRWRLLMPVSLASSLTR